MGMQESSWLPFRIVQIKTFFRISHGIPVPMVGFPVPMVGFPVPMVGFPVPMVGFLKDKAVALEEGAKRFFHGEEYVKGENQQVVSTNNLVVPGSFYLEDHPSQDTWLITMVIVSPLFLGLWDPFQMAELHGL